MSKQANSRGYGASLSQFYVVAGLFFLWSLNGLSSAWALDQTLMAQAEEALTRVTAYLTTKVSYGGGYGGVYLPDLSDQWGEGHITRTQNWIQPPGTPSTGFAFLEAWEATHKQQFLEAAIQVAHALVNGQLACGGWDYVVDHSPEGARNWFYRRHRNANDPALRRGRNTATFDDNTTQHATRFLIAMDQALQGQDGAIHEATMAALELIVQAQHESGGWPQRYPPSGRGYSDFLTYNDDTIADCADVMMMAAQTYGDVRYAAAVRKCGDFIIRTQLPAPQSIWAQQYDLDLKPAWARRFEPPAACAGESLGVMRLLLQIALFTNEAKYLEPLPAAFDWYRRSQLPEGLWARFYELKTNRPLYFTKDYRLTYSDADVPTHYAFKGNWNPRAIEAQYNEILQKGLQRYKTEKAQETPMAPEQRRRAAEQMEPRVREIIAAQEPSGAWLTTSGPNVPAGQLRLDMEYVQKQMRVLSQYLKLATGL